MQAVKFALLGLLSEEPGHGYELRNDFQELLGGAWPLNVGQVYATLARLERDGLVESTHVPQDPLPDRKVYAITREGRAELERWLAEPTQGPLPLRDELFVKVLVSARTGAATTELIDGQRRRLLRTMGDLAAIRADDKVDANTKLIVDGAMLHVEADLRWLELCEDRWKGRGKR